jgi:hypothetical protein
MINVVEVGTLEVLYPFEFSATEPGLQSYGNIQRNTLHTEFKKCRSQSCKSIKFYYEHYKSTCILHSESKQHTKMYGTTNVAVQRNWVKMIFVE